MGDFIYDPVGDAGQHFRGEPVPIGGHPIMASYGAEGNGIGVGALVAHYPNRPDIGQDGKGLPNFPVESGFFDLFHKNGVSFAKQVQFFPGHLA